MTETEEGEWEEGTNVAALGGFKPAELSDGNVHEHGIEGGNSMEEGKSGGAVTATET